jgi:hypothetical protein
MDEENVNRKLDRRRLLGRAGAVAATVVGAGAVGAALNGQANAAPGDPVVQGQLNNALTSATTLQNNHAVNPTLALQNTSLTEVVPGFDEAGPSLQLLPGGDRVNGPVGSLGADVDGTLWTVGPILNLSGTSTPQFLRSSENSFEVVTFSPVRMMDTRNAPGQVNVINPEVINGDGFVTAGSTLRLDLDPLFILAWSAFGNITVIGGTQNGGFVTAWPNPDPQPLASNINFNAGQVIANSCAVSVGFELGVSGNVINFFTNRNVKIIFDVAGAAVNYREDILLPGFGLPGLTGGAGGQAGVADRVEAAAARRTQLRRSSGR